LLNPDLYVEESLLVDSIKSPRILVRESEAPSVRDNTVRELAASMRQHGLLHPIIVRPIEEGFEIVAGNRRFEACSIGNIFQPRLESYPKKALLSYNSLKIYRE